MSSWVRAKARTVLGSSRSERLCFKLGPQAYILPTVSAGSLVGLYYSAPRERGLLMRLECWDYSSNAVYFITFCTYRRKHVFGYVEPAVSCFDRAHVSLNDAGRACAACIKGVPQFSPGVKVDSFVVMPNHVHLLLRVDGAMRGSYRSAVARAVGGLKASISKIIHQRGYVGPVWQTGFHDHICRNEADYRRIYSYIDTNPDKWAFDRYFE
jgi:putative transposase